MPKFLVPVKIEMYGLALVEAESASEAKKQQIPGGAIVADESNSGSFESVKPLRLKAIEVPEELEDTIENWDNDHGIGGIIDVLEENGIDVDDWLKKIG